MAFTKYILPALALSGAAWAQSSSGCQAQTNDDGVYEIQNQGDASALQNCATFDGSILIQPQAAGTLLINGVQRITGNLTAINATGLTSLEGDQLSTIDGTFRLLELPTLSNLAFGNLATVDIINFEALAGLQQFGFTNGITTASGVRVVNTQLANMEGINLKTVAAIEVLDNPFMTDFNVNELKNITNEMTVAANGEGLTIEFPNLVTAANLTFRNISGLQMPSLANVTGSFGNYGNVFKSFEAGNLSIVGDAFVFDGCTQLTNISVPLLTQVLGGLQITSNTNLKSVNGFPQLKTVGGALEMSGPIANASFPALRDVRGGFNVTSSSDLDCSQFDSDHSSKVIKGTYVCEGVANPSSSNSGSGGSSTTSGSGSSSTSTHHNGAPSTKMNLAAMGVFGAIAGLFMI